ncbi:antibiotic biosynthesis monooxygenase family protein [Polyangium jinanense]|uniref:Antibiotic biosynthesis monooxygenase n=1 Tax=Polyangium jinanense TaxID=2829994 RepID=A0A9X4B0L5_9BACT|nr:antibiotic biosynthesis monooxygenase [Polyangium jinanense]MDC3962395.1 antibiotic biosynthesis monooxygenase [Polyangium jinanense]MDC3989287.1 antibiotic biosynthesis monooxygenase [Polyangium jinanense]
MVTVIDLLQTSNRSASTSAWNAVCTFLSEQPGFQGGQLLESFQTITPRASCEMASICRWRSDEDWERARSAVRRDQALVAVLSAAGTKFTGFKMDLVDGSQYLFNPPSDNMVLVDVVYLPEDRMAAYAAMWAEAARHMSRLPGYVNSSLFRSRNLAGEVKFMNIAEWKSSEAFFDAVRSNRFTKVVEPFKADFSLYLNRRIALHTARER